MERKNKRPRQEQEEEEMDIGNDGVVFKIFIIKLRKWYVIKIFGSKDFDMMRFGPFSEQVKKGSLFFVWNQLSITLI